MRAKQPILGTTDTLDRKADRFVQKVDLDRGRQVAPQIFEQLRDDIVSLRIPPGTVLSRIELMQRFGVSQTPIRDAMLRLADEKLVNIFAQHATAVSPIDVDLAEQAHFLRMAIELEVLRRLTFMEDRSFIDILSAELQLVKSLVDKGAFAQHRKLDLSFHKRLCDFAGVTDLWRLATSRSGHLDRMRNLCRPNPEDGVADHIAILAAVEKSDLEQAQSRMRTHLSRTLLALSAVKDQYPEYFSGGTA